MSTEKKIAAVTGGGSGIGQAIARRLAADGFHVAILEREAERAAESLALIEDAGDSGVALPCDVADLDSVKAAFDELPTIDVLVNNAGISSIGNVEEATPEEMDRLYAVNIKGVYHCLHLAVPRMVAQGSGAVLNLASVASKLGLADRFAYSATKGAVFAMTLSVAKDYVDKGVRCNCICPARVHTPFVDGYLEKNYDEADRGAMFEELSAWQPIGRMARPEEIGNLAAFLCSDQASFITGSAYDIDGGVTLLR